MLIVGNIRAILISLVAEKTLASVVVPHTVLTWGTHLQHERRVRAFRQGSPGRQRLQPYQRRMADDGPRWFPRVSEVFPTTMWTSSCRARNRRALRYAARLPPLPTTRSERAPREDPFRAHRLFGGDGSTVRNEASYSRKG